MRTKRYKLVHYYHDIDAWELFDLAKDPTEVKNVYDDPAYQNIAEELHQELKRLQAMYGDQDETEGE